MTKTLELYKPHEAAKAMPRPTESARASIKQSIREFGVRDPIVVWMDGDSRKVLADGITRQEIVAELYAEEIKTAENGYKIELSEMLFEGSEEELLHFIEDKALRHRHTTSLQRAAIAIHNGALARKYRKKETGEVVAEINLDDGDLAQKVAEKYDTSRTYIFQCAKIGKASKELLKQVIANEITGPEALKAVDRIERGLKPFAAEGEEESGGDEVKVAAPVVIYDAYKNPVDEQFVHIFSVRNDIREINRTLKKVLADAEVYAQGPGGCNVDEKSLLSDIRGVIRTLSDSQPHVLCVYCSGTGKDSESSKKKCPNCHGSAFLDKLQWKLVPEELKATVPGATAPAESD